MLLAGDELGRTQGGNNNAYCQDNETSWLDWPDDAPLAGFVAHVLRARRSSPELRRRQVRHSDGDDVAWYRPDGEPMTDGDWGASYARAVAVRLAHGRGILLVNAWWEPLDFRVPAAAGDGPWSVVVDTAVAEQRLRALDGAEVRLEGRSLMLIAAGAA